MPIRHQRLFFRTDEVSYLIVVFLVLVTLTSFRSSFFYPSASNGRKVRHNWQGAALDGEFFLLYFFVSVGLAPHISLFFSSCPSNGHHDKATAVTSVLGISQSSQNYRKMQLRVSDYERDRQRETAKRLVKSQASGQWDSRCILISCSGYSCALLANSGSIESPRLLLTTRMVGR